jgi:hypothetical protein
MILEHGQHQIVDLLDAIEQLLSASFETCVVYRHCSDIRNRLRICPPECCRYATAQGETHPPDLTSAGAGVLVDEGSVNALISRCRRASRAGLLGGRGPYRSMADLRDHQ